MKAFVRVKYTGPDTNLGSYGWVTTNAQISISRADWTFMTKKLEEGEAPEGFEVLGESDEDKGKVLKPRPTRRNAPPAPSPEGGNGAAKISAKGGEKGGGNKQGGGLQRRDLDDLQGIAKQLGLEVPEGTDKPGLIQLIKDKRKANQAAKNKNKGN